MTIPEKAVSWAVQIANSSVHGYDQASRWGPDYDCSSLVISAYEQAGVPVKRNGATYTGNMRSVFKRCGFSEVSGPLEVGDVLLNEKNHTALYIGNNQIIQAHSNERGSVTGGQSGDQTGREIEVRSYYNYPWDCVLRYTKTEGGDPIKMEIKRAYGSVILPIVEEGMVGGDVLSVQVILNHKWGITLDTDADFGPKTKAAVMSFQSWKKLEVDGVVGPETYAALIGGHK